MLLNKLKTDPNHQFAFGLYNRNSDRHSKFALQSLSSKNQRRQLVQKIPAIKKIRHIVEVPRAVQKLDVISDSLNKLQNQCSTEQIAFLKQCFETSANIHLVAPHKAGKSFAVKKFIEILEQAELESKVQTSYVVATMNSETAMSYKNGYLLDSWLAVDSVRSPLEVVYKKGKVERQKWAETNLLIIENSHLLDVHYLKVLRLFCDHFNPKMRFIFCGDENDDLKNLPEYDKFSFSYAMLGTNYKCSEEKSDDYYSNLVIRISKNSPTEVDLKFLKSLFIPQPKPIRYSQLNKMSLAYETLDQYKVSTIPIQVFSNNWCFHDINEDIIRRIQPTIDFHITYRARENVQWLDVESKRKNTAFFETCRKGPIKETVSICLGAQVILLQEIRNAENNTIIVPNYSVGVVTDFTALDIAEVEGVTPIRMPIVKFKNIATPQPIVYHVWKSDGATYSQLPIALGWVMSLHNTPEFFSHDAELYLHSKATDCLRDIYTLLLCARDTSLLKMDRFNMNNFCSVESAEDEQKENDVDDDDE